MDNPSDHMPGEAATRPFSVGVTLSEARKQMGLSVADVANRLKFAPRQIEALEADNFARLPELAFVRGFVRSYARLLQLDPLPLLAALPQPPEQAPVAPDTITTRIPFPHASTTRQLNMLWLAGGVGVAIILGLFVWLHEKAPPPVSSEPETAQTIVEPVALPAVEATPVPTEITKPSAIPSAKPSAKPSAAPSAQPSTNAAPVPVAKTPPTGVLIYMVFEADSWVEITDKDGKPLMGQLNLRGSERKVNGNPPFSLLIGNASQVRLFYRGKQIDLTPYNRAEVAHLTLE
ncbi:MAG: DUF4115 domain-containing protein [Gallionellaceae bacterium]|nr:DUF4115 domain-containing protein [Gallionellaceae bacterium]